MDKKRQQIEKVGKHTKIIWRDPNEVKIKILLLLGEKESERESGVTNTLTGHMDLLAHLYKVGCADNSMCRVCGEDVKTLVHCSVCKC